MSQWTHVYGIIRFNALRVGLPRPVRATDVEDVVGYSYRIDWDGDLGEIPNNASQGLKVPGGSEGPIQYQVIENPHKPSLAAFDVPVWGDLRDKGAETIREVGDWLARIIDDSSKSAALGLAGVRDLVVKVDVEYGPSYVFSLDDEGLLQEKEVAHEGS